MIELQTQSVMTIASKDDKTRRRIQAIVRALAAAFDRTARDGGGHAGAHRAAQRVRRLAQGGLERKGPILLHSDVLAGFERASGLARALRRHHIQCLALLPGASTYEFRALMGELASEPRSGGLEAALKRLRVRRLRPVRSQPVSMRALDLAATAASAIGIFASLPGLSAELKRIADAGARAVAALTEEIRLGRNE